jgi:hypothetical protein
VDERREVDGHGEHIDASPRWIAEYKLIHHNPDYDVIVYFDW